MATTNWSTVVNTTTQQYLKEAEDNIMRERVIPALLKSKGRILYDQFYGKELEWKVRYRRAQMAGFADGDTLTFGRLNRIKSATLDMRGYAVGEMVSKIERLKNRSNAQILDLWGETTGWMLEDIEENFADEFFVNGNLAANSKKIHGIETFLTTSGTTSGTAPVKLPNATYAGLSCAVATAGSWTGDWPNGKGSAEYDYWSPVLVDVTNANWGASPTWATRGHDAIRYMGLKLRRNKAKKGKPDVAILDDESYRKLLTLEDGKQRQVVTANDGIVALGFGNTIRIDGLDVTHEYGMPVDTAYVFNTSQMELRSAQSKLFEVEGPEYVQATKSYNISIDFFGNLRFNPRYFGKIYPYT